MKQSQRNKGVIQNLMDGSILLRDLKNMFLGFLPIGLGIFGIVQHFRIEKNTYKGTQYDLQYIHKETNRDGGEAYEVQLVVEKDTIQFNIEVNEVGSLFAFKSKEAYKEIVETAVRDLKENEDVVIIYHINGVSKFIVKDKTIIRYHSAFWWGLLFIVIGGYWVWIYIDLFRKDPTNEFEAIKDPFSKYKK